MIKALSLMAAAVVAMGLSVSLAQAESPDSVFHAHVANLNVAPVTHGHVAVGEVIPDTTELQPVPDAIVDVSPGFADHGYYVSQDHIHVIHPDTRAVVAVIDRR